MKCLVNQQGSFSEIDKKALEMYLKGISLVQISNQLKVDRGSLTNRLKNKYGIEPVLNGQKYHSNFDYFETIDSEEKAYWLGFMYADGYNSGKLIELCLQASDKGHLQKFKNALESTNLILERPKQNAYRISISNSKLCKDLSSWGCINQKSLICKIPLRKLNQHLIKHFIRGFFDGDGTISSVQIRKNTKKASTLLRYINSIFFTTRSEKMAQDLVKTLKKYAHVNSYISNDKRGNTKSVVIQGQNNIRTFLDYIYQNSTVYLDRKFYQYLQYILPSGVETLQMINGEKIWNPAMGIRGEGSFFKG